MRTRLTLLFRNLVMGVFEQDGTSNSIVECPDECRPRWERLLREGFCFSDYPEHKGYFSKYNASPDDTDFLRKIGPGLEAMFGVELKYEEIE